ncbi:MAG: hypothetical protein ABSH32_09615 [Bryobacteraceae bacterium]|jgi:hypothetical protein
MPFRNPILAVFVFLISAAGTPAQTMPAPAGPVQPAALTALNNAFRAAYADAKRRVLASSGPTLIVNGDDFALLRDGRRVEANVGAPIYDPVKTIAHVPLAIYVTLTPGDGAVDNDRLKTLTGLRELIPPAERSLDTLKLPTATLARQKQIVAASLAFLDDVAGHRKFARPALLAFTRRMAPLVMENVTEATRAQLDAIHAQVSAWRRDMSPEEWTRLHVVIVGPHMPRQDLVVMQYFLRLLREPSEGRRVVYAESLWQEPQALDLLGTHLLDGEVGEAFFGDYLRMHRDLLGDAAKQYLPRLLPE